MVLVIARGDFCVCSVHRVSMVGVTVDSHWSELRGGRFSKVRNTTME